MFPGPTKDAYPMENGSMTESRARVPGVTSPASSTPRNRSRANVVNGISTRCPGEGPNALAATERPPAASISELPNGAFGMASRSYTGRTSSRTESPGWYAGSDIRLVSTRAA
jgi:hypothetical protein